MSSTVLEVTEQTMIPSRRPETVIIAGGGLAGLAAGCALADTGYRVTIYERRPYLGGRASSYEHPGTGEVVDNCQHVLLGCCTNLVDFYNRLGVADKIRWYDRLTFIEPGGRIATIGPSWLPAPFHATPAFLRNTLLDNADKLGIARAMLSLMEGMPRESSDSFLEWLHKRGQTQRAIDRFWAPVLISALNEDLDRISVRYAALVFRESFLKSPQAGRMGLPTVPLSELYDSAASYIRERGGEVRLRSSVEGIRPETTRVRVKTADGDTEADLAIVALPFNVVSQILPETVSSNVLRELVGNFQPSPITGIHFWFDREICELDHAVLLDRTIQWMFHKSRLLSGRTSPGGPLAAGSHIELVVSSSKSLVTKSRNEIMDLALRELAEFFPAVKEARVMKSTVIKEVYATFSPSPGSDAYRPLPLSPWPRVFLSGDWTATGWPATMEGAVRAGYASAEALCATISNPRKFLVPDMKPAGLMRFFPA
jgi:squalene-associated FAD-dependent desaturase